jgi:prepilin-type N-terminal cleavage/methylation domain-containing protein
MRERGFTLVELLFVIAIMGTLLAIATLQFNQYTIKANIEKQVRIMYADLMKARSEALMQRTSRTISISPTQMTILDAGGTQISQTSFKYSLSMSNATNFIFNGQGMAKDDTADPKPDTNKTVCVTPAGNPAAIDSILITATGIQMGKWKGSCDSAHFTAK